jgi:hypothetical protein
VHQLVNKKIFDTIKMHGRYVTKKKIKKNSYDSLYVLVAILVCVCFIDINSMPHYIVILHALHNLRLVLQ